MRGLVRSNMQILSQSSIADDIANAKLMYRCVGGSSRNLNKKVYDGTLGSDTVVVGKGRFSVLKNVKGWIYRLQEWKILHYSIQHPDTSA